MFKANFYIDEYDLNNTPGTQENLIDSSSKVKLIRSLQVFARNVGLIADGTNNSVDPLGIQTKSSPKIEVIEN